MECLVEISFWIWIVRNQFQVTLAVVNPLIIDSNSSQMKLVQHYKCIFYVVTNGSIKITHCRLVNDTFIEKKKKHHGRLNSNYIFIYSV